VIFIDTWAWIALADRSDSYHAPAIVRHKQLTETGAKYLTSDYVIGETITYLYGAVPERQAQAFIASLLAAADAATYEFVHVSAHQFRRAWWLTAEISRQARHFIRRLHLDGCHAGHGRQRDFHGRCSF